jgi:hypothetical protein
LQWQHRAVAAALQELTTARAAQPSTTRVRQLLELSNAAMATAVALMLAEERDASRRAALESVSDAATAPDPAAAPAPAEDATGGVSSSALLSLPLMRALAERLVEAGSAHASALGAVTTDLPPLAGGAAAFVENSGGGGGDDDDEDDVSGDEDTIQAATASANKIAVLNPDKALASALERADQLVEDAKDESGHAFGEFAADSDSEDNHDAYAGGIFVDEAEHVGSSNPDEAWPCYEVAVVDGVWRERDLRAVAALHRPPRRAETMNLLASWLDNAAHPHGRALSLFLTALLHCISSHRAGATQARVRLADASRLLPGGTGGEHRCRICGNQYGVLADLDMHVRRRHARTIDQANAAAVQRNDREDARALLDESVLATKAFIASTYAAIHRQYAMLPARALRDALEHLVLERVYPHLAALYAHADEHASAQLDERIDALSDLHPAVFDVNAVFWPLLGVREMPCRDGRLARVDHEHARRVRSQGISEPPAGVTRDNMIIERAGPPLNALASYTSVSGKLRALTAVGGIVSRCVERHFGAGARVVLGADDLLPLILYIIVRTQPRSLLSQLHAMEAFITRDAVNGKYGYFLVTATMAVEFISTLNVATLKAEFQAKAVASGMQFAAADEQPAKAATLEVPAPAAAAAAASATAPASPSKSLGVPGLLANLGSLSPRLRSAMPSAAATLAAPVAPDSDTAVVQVNATHAQVSEFFAKFGVVGDEDVLVRHSCLCKESSSLRRGVLVVTTRRLAFYRKSVQIVAEWARIRAVSARRGSGAAFGASIEVSVRASADSDINVIYTFSAFQCMVDPVIAHIEAARAGAKATYYRDFSCKFQLPSTPADKPVQLQPIVLRIDESDAAVYDGFTKELLEKHSLRRVRKWTQQPPNRVVVDVGAGEMRAFVVAEAPDDIVFWLHFVTNRVASRLAGAAPSKVSMADHFRPNDAHGAGAPAAPDAPAPAVPESVRNKAALGSRQLQQLTGSLDLRVAKHVSALRAEALLTSVAGLADENAGSHAQTLMALADRLEACKPAEDARPARSPSLLISDADAAAGVTGAVAAAAAADDDGALRARSRTRDWHALCSNYATNVRDIALQEAAPLQLLWALASAQSDDASALHDALFPVRATLLATLEAVSGAETALGAADASDRRIADTVAALGALK